MKSGRNQELDRLIEEMVDKHAYFIKGFADLFRQAYALGKRDERLGIHDEREKPKQLMG